MKWFSLFRFFAPVICLVSAWAAIDVQRTDAELKLERAGRPILTYNLKPVTSSTVSTDSGAFFHPLKTPAGVVVTDIGPGDHRHHRGIFLAWIEMRGEKDADFWGWGKHAPTKDRRIVNRQATVTPDGFTAKNEWVAEGVVIIEEMLEAVVGDRADVNLLDLTYRITPRSDVTLARWNFGGFCLRGRAEGKVEFYSPSGPSATPNPSPAKPESAWPDAAWYALGQVLPDGTKMGAAVIGHRGNPSTKWHNHRKLSMLNPGIVADAPMRLAGGKTLVLRYRVVAFDGTVPSQKLDQLAREFSAK